jgi:cell division initiation protein
MLTPRTIHQTKFSHVFKGYNPKEVDNFLSRVVSEYETLFQENVTLKERLAQLEQEVKGYSTDTSTQQLIELTKEAVEKLKSSASKEAENIIRRAELQAKEVISLAKEEADGILKRAGELKQEEKRVRHRLRVLLETGLEMLNDHNIDDKVDEIYEEIEEKDDLMIENDYQSEDSPNP